MKTPAPIDLLKNKLAELKSIPGAEPALMIEYEKAILVLEFIGVSVLDDKINETNELGNSEPFLNNETKKEPESYFDRFMEGQKNKNNRSE